MNKNQTLYWIKKLCQNPFCCAFGCLSLTISIEYGACIAVVNFLKYQNREMHSTGGEITLHLCRYPHTYVAFIPWFCNQQFDHWV